MQLKQLASIQIFTSQQVIVAFFKPCTQHYQWKQRRDLKLISHSFVLDAQTKHLLFNDTFRHLQNGWSPTTSHDILERAMMCVCACSIQNKTHSLWLSTAPTKQTVMRFKAHFDIQRRQHSLRESAGNFIWSRETC